MGKIALILSGCGQQDGSETHETILTLLALQQSNLSWEAFAPDSPQKEVFDHYKNHVDRHSSRNMLTEGARLVRGQIKPLSKAMAENFSAVIVPGGTGVIKNLSNYEEKGIHFELHPEFKTFMEGISKNKIPAGFICIAPILIPKLYSEKPKLTIGEDQSLAVQIEQMGGIHCVCPATEVIVDDKNKVVSTPANMVAQHIGEVFEGINKLVIQIKEMTVNR